MPARSEHKTKKPVLTVFCKGKRHRFKSLTKAANFWRSEVGTVTTYVKMSWSVK